MTDLGCFSVSIYDSLLSLSSHRLNNASCDTNLVIQKIIYAKKMLAKFLNCEVTITSIYKSGQYKTDNLGVWSGGISWAFRRTVISYWFVIQLAGDRGIDVMMRRERVGLSCIDVPQDTNLSSILVFRPISTSCAISMPST